MKTPEKRHSKNPGRIHRALVEQLVRDARPVKRVPSAAIQWLEWICLSLAAMAGVILFFHSGSDFWKEMFNIGSGFFILFTLTGSALAAWGAILSSLPGRCCKTWRFPMALIVVGLLLIPFFYFPFVTPLVMGCILGSGWDFLLVFLVGFIPWTVLGFRLSKNAIFNPVITGAWSGLSAFLMATCTLYICCPCGSIGHMFFDHLLPVAIGTLLTALAGAFWFSQWRNDPK